MTKKITIFIIVCSFVVGGIGGWVLMRYVLPKLNAIPFLVKYNLTAQTAPIIINTRQEIHVNEGSDSIAAIQRVKPWMVGILGGTDVSHTQIISAGLILTSDGLIATTHAALQPLVPAASGKNVPANPGLPQTVNVQLTDGTVLSATVRAEDSFSDLVFLKAEGRNLGTAAFGNPKDLQLGQRMIILAPAIGEYQANDVVSYLSSEIRDLKNDDVFSSERQSRTFGVDNITNQLEGATVLSLDENVQGIYSHFGIITADTIKSALNSYFNNNNKIVRNYLGIYYVYLPKSVAALYGTQEGIMLRRPDAKTAAVIPQSPAAEAGLAEGDIIYKVGDTQINFDNSFEELFAKYSPGQSISLTFLRGGAQKTVNLTVGAK